MFECFWVYFGPHGFADFEFVGNFLPAVFFYFSVFEVLAKSVVKAVIFLYFFHESMKLAVSTDVMAAILPNVSVPSIAFWDNFYRKDRKIAGSPYKNFTIIRIATIAEIEKFLSLRSQSQRSQNVWFPYDHNDRSDRCAAIAAIIWKPGFRFHVYKACLEFLHCYVSVTKAWTALSYEVEWP